MPDSIPTTISIVSRRETITFVVNHVSSDREHRFTVDDVEAFCDSIRTLYNLLLCQSLKSNEDFEGILHENHISVDLYIDELELRSPGVISFDGIRKPIRQVRNLVRKGKTQRRNTLLKKFSGEQRRNARNCISTLESLERRGLVSSKP